MGRRRRRQPNRLPPLSVDEILRWADEHHARTGRWPTVESGKVRGTLSEKWRGLDMDLRRGYRGLPGGTSLARLLAERRGVRNIKQLPPLSCEQILAWADAHHERTGTWPMRTSGPVLDAPGETWMALQVALANGRRRLPGGSSLSALLARERGVRNHMDLPPLTEARILRWCDAHRRRTAEWPREKSGPILEAPGETWANVDIALEQGHRGLPGGSSVPRLLAARRGVRNAASPGLLTVQQVLAWAEAHHGRTGRWPTAKSGPIPEAPGETWMRVATAFYEGLRGLPPGGSLARLLAERCAVPDQRRRS